MMPNTDETREAEIRAEETRRAETLRVARRIYNQIVFEEPEILAVSEREAFARAGRGLDNSGQYFTELFRAQDRAGRDGRRIRLNNDAATIICRVLCFRHPELKPSFRTRHSRFDDYPMPWDTESEVRR